MEPLVDIVIEDPRWENLGLDRLAEWAIETSFAALGMSKFGYCLCVMGCDNARIAVLNGDFRSKTKPTNVLSWPSFNLGPVSLGAPPRPIEPGLVHDPKMLGDIALAYETCAQEAQEQNKTLSDHVAHLIVHGFLHLLGYDHVEDLDAEFMENQEREILTKMGLCDPYIEAT